jgi:V/A-type H+-transporting ATPase subunit F
MEVAENTKFGKIAFVGERELAIGFKLVGIEDAFISDAGTFSDKLKELFYSGNYGLILASNSFINSVEKKFLSLLNISVSPLVVFVPVAEMGEEEGVSDLARRVLGIKMDLGGI